MKIRHSKGLRHLVRCYWWNQLFSTPICYWYVTWLIDMWRDTLKCDMTHLICDMTHRCVTWPIDMWHDSLMCDMTHWYMTWLIDTATDRIYSLHVRWSHLWVSFHICWSHLWVSFHICWSHLWVSFHICWSHLWVSTRVYTLHSFAHCVYRRHGRCNSGVTCATYATHCNILQHTATHCNILQHTAKRCNSGATCATYATVTRPAMGWLRLVGSVTNSCLLLTNSC